MNYKNVSYDVKYIDLQNKPDWFLKISPLGKVPVLQVGEDVLFESAVINEYVDETNGDSLHPKDPLAKAKERAYIELSSAAMMNYFHATISKDEQGYLDKKVDLEKNLNSLLDQFKGPFFRGNEFSLVDTSVIPLLQRLVLTGNFATELNLSKENKDKFNSWLDNTLNMDAVKNSVPENFESDYKDYLKERESYIFLK
jgi:glutathione S-transferase